MTIYLPFVPPYKGGTWCQGGVPCLFSFFSLFCSFCSKDQPEKPDKQDQPNKPKVLQPIDGDHF